jgi:hypothetical protein
MLGFAIAATIAPLNAQASDYEYCLLYSGCYFDSNTLSWICPDPSIYALCVE